MAVGPYLGPDTFEFRHREVFFGRSSEGRVVASMIASEPLTILTGASGTGKSSLLRAQILPTLVSREWCAVYAHPQGDPVESLCEELIGQTLPDPAFERRTLVDLIKAGDGELRNDSTLAEACEWFGTLDKRSPLRAKLIAPLGDGKIPRYAKLTQMLAGILTPRQLEAQISALTSFVGVSPPEGEWTIKTLSIQLESADAGRAKAEQLLRGDDKSLTGMIERVSIGWIAPLNQLGVVLVLDQAEELYTSFGATQSNGITALHDWRKREALFEEARQFAKISARWPVRLCFSLRPEWYAVLRVSLEQSIEDESRSAYFLSRFDHDHAEEAIVEPARVFKGEVTAQAVKYALEELGKSADRGEIDPFILAITFHEAWHIASAREGPTRVTLADLENIAEQASLDGARSLVSGAIKLLLSNGLDQLGAGEELDGITLLSTLFNEDRTRRIVPENELIRRPLRDRNRLLRLLDRLDEAGLIRRFKRGDLTLIEVRHERIALPVFDRMESIRKNEDQDQGAQKKGRFRSLLGRALNHLMTYNGAHLDAYIAGGLEEDPLPAWATVALRSNYEDVSWDQAAARTLLASLLHVGPEPLLGGGQPDYSKMASESLDWEEWRKLVGYLMPIAGERLAFDVRKFIDSRDIRDEVEALLLRGTRVQSDAANACLNARLRDVTPDTRLALMRSILSSPHRSDRSL